MSADKPRTVAIYHMKDGAYETKRPRLADLRRALREGDAEGLKGLEREFIKEFQFTHVADIVAVDVEAAYGLSNNIDHAWIDNNEVTLVDPKTRGLRSTDVGDILVVDGVAQCCDSFGWLQLSEYAPAILASRPAPNKAIDSREVGERGLIFDGGRGFNFKALIVMPSEAYGSNPKVFNSETEALIELYDGRHMHTEHGQIISRYYASTFLSNAVVQPPRGINLSGDVDDWQIDGARVDLVGKWVSEKLGITPERIAAAEAALSECQIDGTLKPSIFKEGWTSGAADTLLASFDICVDGIEAFQRERIDVAAVFAPGASELLSLSATSKGVPFPLGREAPLDMSFGVDGPA